MHELVREWQKHAGPRARLARLPLDDGALVVAFLPHRRRSRMVWLAKSVHGTAGCRRLRAEHAALARLAPLGDALRIPQVLAWSETGNGAEATACLLQSAVEGEPMRSRWSGRGWRFGIPTGLEAAGAWLRQFQSRVRGQPGLDPDSHLTAVEQVVRTRAGEAPERAQALLTPLLAQLAEVRAEAQCVTIHGDFWAGNLVWSRGQSGELGVVDWSGLGAGSALDDLLTFMASLPDATAPVGARQATWERLWFRPGRPREYLRRWAAEVGYTGVEARYAFYLFLARRLAWELGLDMQARSAAERERAAAEWGVTLAWLTRQRYPDPFR